MAANDPVVNTASPATALLLDTDLGSASLPVTDGTGYAQDEFVRVTPPAEANRCTIAWPPMP